MQSYTIDFIVAKLINLHWLGNNDSFSFEIIYKNLIIECFRIFPGQIPCCYDMLPWLPWFPKKDKCKVGFSLQI